MSFIRLLFSYKTFLFFCSRKAQIKKIPRSLLPCFLFSPFHLFSLQLDWIASKLIKWPIDDRRGHGRTKKIFIPSFRLLNAVHLSLKLLKSLLNIASIRFQKLLMFSKRLIFRFKANISWFLLVSLSAWYERTAKYHWL